MNCRRAAPCTRNAHLLRNGRQRCGGLLKVSVGFPRTHIGVLQGRHRPRPATLGAVFAEGWHIIGQPRHAAGLTD